MPRKQLSRRRFLQASAAAGVATPIIMSTPLYGQARKPPSERVTLGFIGVGTMGRYHLHSFLGNPEVQVVAVCDVVKERLEQAQKDVQQRYAAQKGKGSYDGCQAYHDFHDLLGSEEIDAVVIATPDHWHAIPCVEAARAGKDIYCEKPLTLAIAQGQAIIREVRESEVVFQTGSQQRTEFGGFFRKAVELVRNGHIGQVKTVRIGVGAPAVPCDLPTQPVPSGTDWDFWLGPAPKRGYNDILCPKGIHKHFPAWRNYREYAGGILADMGAHHFDIAQWALGMDKTGPVKVKPPLKGNSGLKFTYANGIEMYHGGPTDCTFEGTEGTIFVSRGKLWSKPERIAEQPLAPGDLRCYPANNHHKNWLDCVR